MEPGGPSAKEEKNPIPQNDFYYDENLKQWRQRGASRCEPMRARARCPASPWS